MNRQINIQKTDLNYIIDEVNEIGLKVNVKKTDEAGWLLLTID